jgi:hypothetical protein
VALIGKKKDEYDTVYSEKDKKKKDYSHLYDGGSRRKPTGCESCGGPYPLCKDGCAAFDNE